MPKNKTQDPKSAPQDWRWSFLSALTAQVQPKQLARVRSRPPPAHGDRWGAWFYDSRGGLLIRKEEHGPEYSVALSDLVDAHGLVDGLAKLTGKTWLSDADLGSFVRAVADLIGLQGLAQRV
jgi:hypothetical protein